MQANRQEEGIVKENSRRIGEELPFAGLNDEDLRKACIIAHNNVVEQKETMAQNFLISPPEKMVVDGHVAGNWEFFKDAWNNYAIAVELSKKDNAIQVATLLSVMGKDCLSVFKNLPMTEDEKKDPAEILKKLTKHFEPAKNTIYERFSFNSCVQGKDTSDVFVSKLRQLAASCAYGALKEELIRDRIVIGIADSALRARLLREKDLTLDKAILMCRSSEITSLQLQKMTLTEDVHYVKNKQKKRKPMIKNCTFCSESHERRKCPAYGHVCSICHRENHYEKTCRHILPTCTNLSVIVIDKPIGLGGSVYTLTSIFV